MFKKFLAVLFVFFGIYSLINANPDPNVGSAVGYAIGTGLPIAANIFAAVVLFFFDNAGKMIPEEGIKTRALQCKGITVLVVVYAIITVLLFLGGLSMINLLTVKYGLSGAGAFALMLGFELLGVVPLMIFIFMYIMYAAPFKKCRKLFGYKDGRISAYLPGDKLETYDAKGTVCANKKALYFPKLACIVPFEQIASVQKIKSLAEEDVRFHLTNGKKITIVSKQYDAIMTAIEAAKSAENVQ